MRVIALMIVLAVVGAVPGTSVAFSVLAHQAVIDQSWEKSLVPAFRRRFPNASGDEIERARAFAYGGTLIHDLGYFPLGNVFFTDLVHYVRSGDFIAALVASAETLDEYAFALGGLSHWVTDDIGHPEATNRAVPEIYPKLRKKYGDTVTYADDRSSHIQTEFRFDVLAVSRSRETPDLFRHALAFEVSESLLDRAFQQTYGLHLNEVFANTKVAITTYRWAFREVIHEATGIAWELYRADIKKLDPEATPAGFVFDLSRGDFEKQFGDAYRRPGYFFRFIGFLGKLVPNVGPLRRLPYRPLPPHVQQLFVDALERCVVRYQTTVPHGAARRVAFVLVNENLDIGRPTGPGEYEPADETYTRLLETLDRKSYAGVPRSVRDAILRFYEDPNAAAFVEKHPKEWLKVSSALARLDAAPLGP